MVRAITLCTELSICQCLGTWTEHPSQNELHILFFNSTILDYLYVPELSTLHNLNFLFCKGEILSTIKKTWTFMSFWMVGLLVHTNLTFMSYHMHVLFSFYFFAQNQRHTNLNSSTLTSWTSHVNVNAGRFYSVCSLDRGSHTTWTSHACKQADFYNAVL